MIRGGLFMARILKVVDYMTLLSTIYKRSNYDKEKSTILFNYVSYNLIKYGFKTIYVNKLALDLNLLVLEDKEIFEYTNHNYEATNLKMEEKFSFFEVVEIKTYVIDILQKGYYE